MIKLYKIKKYHKKLYIDAKVRLVFGVRWHRKTEVLSTSHV